MYISSACDVVIEVTRRCNMCCAETNFVLYQLAGQSWSCDAGRTAWRNC